MIRDAKCAWERQHLDISKHFHLAKCYFVYTSVFGVVLKTYCHVYHLIWSSQYCELGRKGIYSLLIEYALGTVLGTDNTEINKGNFPVLREKDYTLDVNIANLQMWKKKYQELKASSFGNMIRNQDFWILLRSQVTNTPFCVGTNCCKEQWW